MQTQLTKDQLKELNLLLSDSSIDIPDFRREVRESGTNIEWLRKRIKVRNPNLNPRIQVLLGIQ